MEAFEKIIDVIRSESMKNIKDSSTISNQIIKQGIIHADGTIDLGDISLDKEDYEIYPDIKFNDGDRVLIFKSGDESFTVVCTLDNFDNRNTDTFNILDVYPVGSIYLSVSSTNPSNIFGGTWVRWGNGRAVVGVSDSDNDFYPAEAKHGSKNLQQHSHTITNTSIATTVNEAGAHTHTFHLRQDGVSSGSKDRVGTSVYTTTTQDAMEESGAHTHTITISGTTDTSGTGGSKNLQPYITCYMWKRTA